MLIVAKKLLDLLPYISMFVMLKFNCSRMEHAPVFIACMLHRPNFSGCIMPLLLEKTSKQGNLSYATL